MATLRIVTDLDKVLSNVEGMLRQIMDKEYLLRPVAVELLPMVTRRIHIDGKASDDKQIGTYSEGYMKVRTGNFGNSARFTRGKKEGKTKNAGDYSRGAKKGQPRPRYNRNADTKVVVSLTRQLENDWGVSATQNGYGLGFSNPHNADKMRWVEQTYRKEISSLTKAEIDYAFKRINQLVTDAISL